MRNAAANHRTEFFRTIPRSPPLTGMDIADKGMAARLLVLLAPIALLAACTVAPAEAYPEQPSGTAYPDEKALVTERPVSEVQPTESAGPAVRRDTAPPRTERPEPVRPLPLPRPPSAARPPTQMPQSPPPQATVKPAAPFPVQVCDPGGCFGPDGKRYGGGVGNIYLDSKGKPCQRIGEWMQCN